MNAKITRKLKINTQGNFQRLWTALILKNKLRWHGIRLLEINHTSPFHAELVVSGDEEQLWKVIHWLRHPPIFIQMDKVKFRFFD